MKAVALIRVSSKKQEFESQTLKVKEAMYRDGFTDDDIILIQDTESGSKLSEEERSGLNKLKHTIETEQISSVYAYEISRISRQSKIVFSIRDYLISKGVDLIILNPYFRLLRDDGSQSETSSIIFGIFASLAEQETYLRVKRITRGKEKKRSEGKLSSGICKVGYTLDSEKFIKPHPVYSAVIREIYERFSNLETSGSIGKDLWMRNALPVKTDKMITYQSYVAAILRDPRYAKINEDSIYPPIVSKEIWYKCQDIIKNRPKYFVRKSMTKETYPLQGYLYNEDGYKLVPSISNNRYLKMRSAGTTTPISLNMKAADELTRLVLNKYLNSGVVEIDLERQKEEVDMTLQNNKIKLSTIDHKISVLQKENDLIQSRIIKGRLSESKGDSMIDSNMSEIYSLEDTRQSLQYQNTLLENKYNTLINPFLHYAESFTINTTQQLKECVNKYIDRIIAHKIGFSHYRLEYRFKDGLTRYGKFYSTCNKIDYEVE